MLHNIASRLNKSNSLSLSLSFSLSLSLYIYIYIFLSFGRKKRGWPGACTKLRKVGRTNNTFLKAKCIYGWFEEDINERQESTNQETIDINKLWPARGFRGCNYMRKMAGSKSAITHISSSLWLLYLPALSISRSIPILLQCLSNAVQCIIYIIISYNSLHHCPRNQFQNYGRKDNWYYLYARSRISKKNVFAKRKNNYYLFFCDYLIAYIFFFQKITISFRFNYGIIKLTRVLEDIN